MAVFPVYLRNEERAFVDALHSILAHLYQRSIRPNRNVLRSCFNLILPSLHPLNKQASLVFSTEKFFLTTGMLTFEMKSCVFQTTIQYVTSVTASASAFLSSSFPQKQTHVQTTTMKAFKYEIIVGFL